MADREVSADDLVIDSDVKFNYYLDEIARHSREAHRCNEIDIVVEKLKAYFRFRLSLLGARVTQMERDDV